MVYAAATGPFVGLSILAVAFPFVHAKGAGISTLLMLTVQLVMMWQTITNGVLPPLMPLTVEHCPQNQTYVDQAANTSASTPNDRKENIHAWYILSPFWSCLFSTVGTVLLGAVISIATGEHRQPLAPAMHTNSFFFKLWQRLREVECVEADDAKEEINADSHATKLLCTEVNGGAKNSAGHARITTSLSL
ncbi:sodium-coupled monocarboxylate transporter 1-like [Haemaphysalis longicornis]